MSTVEINQQTNLNYGKKEVLNSFSLQYLALWSAIVGLVLGAGLPSLGVLINFVLYVWIFVKDRGFLRDSGAFVPAWGWFLIMPVYIYKRQYRNGLGGTWFIVSIVVFILNVLFAIAVDAMTRYPY